MKDLDYPLLDIITSEEIHRALLVVVLQRNKVRDPNKFLEEHAVDSKVIFRNVKSEGGMTAAVVINKAVVNDAATSSPVSADEPKT